VGPRRKRTRRGSILQRYVSVGVGLMRRREDGAGGFYPSNSMLAGNDRELLAVSRGYANVALVHD